MTDEALTRRFQDAQESLVLQAADLSLETIANMVASDAIDLAPEYQRRERWDSARQFALIESFLLNIPVPPVYLSEDEFGRYTAIDGKQRMAAIHAFMKNKLALVALHSFEELNGLRFAALPAALQNALKVRPYVRAVTLLKQTREDLKYEVFTRLNRQGVPLNAQEIRNVLYRGTLNDKILTLSEHPFLRKQLKIKGKKSIPYQEMADCEFVLRFLALRDFTSTGHTPFTGSFRRTMDLFMAERRTIASGKLRHLANEFTAAIEACGEIWGEHAFRRFTGSAWRQQMLAGMYDAQMLAVARLDEQGLRRAVRRRSTILKATEALCSSDKAFEDAVRVGTNTPSKLQYRIECMNNLLA